MKVKYLSTSIHFTAEVYALAKKLAKIRLVSLSKLVKDLIIEECERRGIK